MVVLGEKAPNLLKCIPIDSTSFGSYSPYKNLLISSTSDLSHQDHAEKLRSYRWENCVHVGGQTALI